jgi:3-dehydroquinate synthase class II
LTEDVKVTCDGKDCTAADLKTGMRIRVTTKEGARKFAMQIEALVKNDKFEKRT